MSSFKPCGIIFNGDAAKTFVSPRVAFPMTVELELFGTKEQVRRLTGNADNLKISVRADRQPLLAQYFKGKFHGSVDFIGYIQQDLGIRVKFRLNLANGKGKIERI